MAEEETEKNYVRVESEGTVVAEHSSMKKEKKKKKKKGLENTDSFSGEVAERERAELGDDSVVKKKKVDSEAEDCVKESEKTSNELMVDSEAGDWVKESKRKNVEKRFDSDPEAKDGVKKSKLRVDSEADDVVKKKKVDFEAEDCVKKSERTSNELMVDSEAKDGVKKSKKKNKEKRFDSDSEAKDGVKKSKKKRKEIRSDPEAVDCVQKSKLRVDSEADDVGKTESCGGNEIGNIEGIQRDEKPLVNNDDGKKETGKRKLDDTDLGAEENTDKSNKDIKKKRKKMKPSVVDPEVEGNNEDSSTKDAINEKEKQNVDPEVEGNNKDSSTKDAINEKEKQNVDSEVQENDLNSVKDAKKKKSKKKKKKKLSENAEAEESNNDTTKDAIKEKKKEKKQNVDSEVVENAKDAKKKKRKKKEKLSEDAEAVENNNDGTKDAKKKRKKKEKCSKSDEDVTTPSSKSTKKVKFSDQVEVFPSEDDEKKIELFRGKRFTKEEDALVKQAVLDYIDNHALGDEGLNMVMNCSKHPEIKGCWKEIESALPWRAKSSVYYRAHNLFEEGSKGIWTKEDLELLRQFHTKHGNDWKTIADAMGKHRVHVKDAWRRIRLNTNKGHWSREEYQNLFDLVNTDIRMKAFQEKHSKHGMLRDNIPWMAISDKLGTRGHVHCCEKWYNQLTSPMVAKGIWANVDDYRLLDELMNLDAACIDDVDWDNLLENRDGYACRKRWNQMVLHIGSQGSKTFAEQVEILSQRYCPELAEDRENFDNRPFDPED